MSESLGEQGVSVSARTCKKHHGTTVANDGVPISHQSLGGVYVPSAIEESIAEVVRRFRAQELPVFPEDVKERAAEEM
jgi:hypothetical protein